MSIAEQITGARHTIRRRLAWRQTDAAGHNHFSSAFEWMEEAEHELFRAAGIDMSMIPGIPRVHVELDYRDRMWFGQEVDIEIGVIAVGRTSLQLAFEIRALDGHPTVEGKYVIVHSPDLEAGAKPWSDDVRAALEKPRTV
jgi:acyl-CoA thioester hydrolase